MMLVAQFVNAAALGVEVSSTTENFATVMERVLKTGEDAKFGGISRFPTISKGSPVRNEWAFPKTNVDKRRRKFSVILSHSAETLRADHVELFVAEKDKSARQEKEFSFLVGIDGKLREAGFSVGPLDEKGRFVPGPALAPFQYMNLKSTETQALFRRELDFWIKGIGRKQAPSSKTGAKTAE